MIGQLLGAVLPTSRIRSDSHALKTIIIEAYSIHFQMVCITQK